MERENTAKFSQKEALKQRRKAKDALVKALKAEKDILGVRMEKLKAPESSLTKCST